MTQVLKVKIGGVAGLGSSDATAVISLEKHTFAPGEKVKVHVDMDNSSCKKAVKSYKVKLMRRITCHAGKLGLWKPLLADEDYLDAKKYDGCAEKARD